MSDRINLHRKKSNNSIGSNPALAAATPTLATPSQSVSPQVTTVVPATTVLSQQQDPQLANDRQRSEGEALSQEPMRSIDLSHVPLHSPSKLATGEAGSPSQPDANRAVDAIARMPAPENVTQQLPEIRSTGHDLSRMTISAKHRFEPSSAVISPPIQRQCAACEQEEDRSIQRQPTPVLLPAIQREPSGGKSPSAKITEISIEPSIQRESPDSLPNVPNDRLTPPSLLAPADPSSRYKLGGDLTLHLDPELQAAMQQVREQVNPTIVRTALSQIKLTLPTTDLSTPATTNPLATPTTPAPTATPLVPAGAGPDKPRAASGSDIMDGVLGLPVVDTAVESIKTQASDRFTKDWHRLSTGEKFLGISSVVTIAGGALAGVISDPAARQLALGKLNGKVLPVPGLNWLHLEINTGGDNLMLGLHIDVGRLLPSGLGFKGSAPSAIGGPPETQPLPIQRQMDSAADPESGSNLESQLNASKGGGSPLADDVRSFMEPRFGSDFSGVRVHTGNDAVQMNRDVNAQAFAHGSDIYFGAGKSPGNNELTAHELTHVVQQTGQIQAQTAPGGSPDAKNITEPGDSALTSDTAISESTDLQMRAKRRGLTDISQSSQKILPSISRKSNKIKIVIQRLRLEESTPLAPGNYLYGNKIVSLDPKSMRQMLIDIIVKEGLKKEQIWQQTFAEDLRNQKTNLHSYEDPNSKQTIVVEPKLATQSEQIQESLDIQISAVEKQFQQELINSVGTILTKSEKQIYNEAHRYGFADDESIFQPKPVTSGQGAIQGSLPESAELRKVMHAAKELLEGKRKVKKARKQVKDLGPILGDAVRPQTLEPALLDYHKIRRSLCTDFPILASVERDEEKLAEMASGVGQVGIGESFAIVRAKETLRKEIADKLGNITYVRESMKDSDKIDKFWLDPSLRENARKNLSIQPSTLANTVVEEKIQKIKEDAEFESKLKAAIGIGLLILSFVPGAGLAAGAVGLAMGAVDVSGAFQEYLWEEAASGTAFEKAEAISQSDPSLVGLGISIAFGLLEGIAEAKALEGAISVFKVLRTSYKEARAAAMVGKLGSGAGKTSGAAELLSKLKSEADAQKPGLGDRIVNDLPADVKSFSQDVHQGLEKIKDPELKNLVRNGQKKINETGSTLMDLAAENPQQLEGEFSAWKKSGNKETFEDWLSTQSAKRPHNTISFPSGLVEEGLDAAGARRSYNASIVDDATREVAIWKDPTTGERVCVQGEPGFVETSWMALAENKRSGQMPRWELEMHHHPGRGVVTDTLPSSNDFQSIMHWQTVEGVPKRTQSILTYIDHESKLQFQTEFGFVPGAKRPYWTRYRTSDGKFKIATFEHPPFAEGAAEYDAFVNSFKGDPNAPVPGGNVYPVAETSAKSGVLDSATGVPAEPRTNSKIGEGGIYSRDKQGVVWTEPQTLAEQAAMDAAKSGEGKVAMSGPFGDPKYKDPGWEKWQYLFSTTDGNKIEIHYMKNKVTGQTDQFKFLSRGEYPKPSNLKSPTGQKAEN